MDVFATNIIYAKNKKKIPIGPPIFRTKMKNFLNQQGTFVHCFLGKVALSGRNLFFILVLKIQRNSKKTPNIFL